MRRWTVSILLLGAFLGNVAPIVQALSAPPPHACCIRKKIHPCHESAYPQAGQFNIGDAGCCNRECGRGAVTTQWAHTRPQSVIAVALNVERRSPGLRSMLPGDQVFLFPSGRSPPHPSIA